MIRCPRRMFLMFALLAAPALAQEITITKSSEVTLVLWTANDCHYCASWNGALGGKGDLERWPGFAQVAYIEIERPSLRGSFDADHFTPEQAWLRDDALPTRRASGLVPAWSIYVDKMHVLSGGGTRNWYRTILPKLKEVVEKKEKSES
jgi:hypothetical protein